ncbi:MAG TPA: bifunctional 2-methylcitrate synthase/citrate synthase [Candidatus Acidoferrales bacterium]|jgi:2-methylcitrate synthase|nr:bifunctional 2-methylcitrate synthase/citrate synthase [Candidatus Acidoferrales bacterium]
MSDEANIHRGLDGVVVDTTRISKVMPEINSLVYAGYPVQELCEHCHFEEVAWLMWHGELPTAKQLEDFMALGRGQRDISKDLLSVIQKSPRTAHPMDVLRTGVSFLGMEDKEMDKADAATNLQRSISMMAKIPTMIAAFYRLRKGQDFIPPRSDLGFVENFFHMIFGEVPAPEVVHAFEVSLILYAEHGFNASTFTARTVVSSLSDIYSGVVGGIASLKGPLHGGANEAVMHMLLEVGEPTRAKEWMLTAIREHRVVMGFGHRVYKSGDSRVPTMKKYARAMAEFTGQSKWLDIADILETTMLEQKHIHPNLDFPSGPAYYMMGFDIDMFTPFFVMARITGWTAHIMEQLADNRLIRPLSQYTGQAERRVQPLEKRG